LRPDKKLRDSALTSLRTYLSAQSSISTLDLLKLWKGLFYCLWMQDKPALQQRLARDLAGLLEVLKEDVVMGFLEAFWRTMGREWGGIEALRMDKYLYLVRQYVNAEWTSLAGRNWSGEELEGYMKVLAEIPLSAVDVKIPNGLRYHVLDIYLDELEKVAGDKADELPLDKLLEPVQKLAKESKVKSVRNAAKEVLDDDRLKKWRGEEVDEEMKDGEEEAEEDKEWGGFDD
jgi:ribosomal RNA-processing protein 1